MTTAYDTYQATMAAADEILWAAKDAYRAANLAADLAYDRDYQAEIAAKEQA